MSYEVTVARRYLKSGRAFVSVSTWISMLGVTLGVAAVCVVVSMHNGFETEIRDRLLGTTSHITVFPSNASTITDYDSLVAKLESVDHVVAASPFIYFKGAISSVSGGDGLIVRGIDLEREKRTSDLLQSVTIGDLSFEPEVVGDDTIPGIILGVNLAEGLGVFLGDPVWLYSMRGEDLRGNTRPRVTKFYVAGLLETGMYEFDGQLAYISLQDAQKLFKLGDAATAAHLKLDDIYLASKVAPVIDSLLGHRYDVVPWNILHKNLFSWIAIEKQALGLGFILIVIVAAFSIISTLVMLTMEKRAEIGILKTLGYTPGSIAKIFVYQGLVISVIGVIAGWIISFVLAYLQNTYQLVSLPPDIYFISYLPFEAHLFDFFLAGITAILVCFLASLYPAFKAARLSVIEVLRQ
ncbi:MAG TPA: ABC transporter permease [candidate division Zixibacteria bacterium]|nr:ABC transporter permease [candidate division Zixibacteria bacterium]